MHCIIVKCLDINDDIIQELANNKDIYVRFVIAGRDYLDDAIVKRLSKDKKKPLCEML